MLNVNIKAMECSNNQHWKLRNVMKYHFNIPEFIDVKNDYIIILPAVNHELNAGKNAQTILRQCLPL